MPVQKIVIMLHSFLPEHSAAATTNILPKSSGKCFIRFSDITFPDAELASLLIRICDIKNEYGKDPSQSASSGKGFLLSSNSAQQLEQALDSQEGVRMSHPIVRCARKGSISCILEYKKTIAITINDRICLLRQVIMGCHHESCDYVEKL
jgi:hypothetical protein